MRKAIESLDKQQIKRQKNSTQLNKNSKANEAMNVNGGIDLTSKEYLQTKNSGEAIKFHINPAQLSQLQNALGFVPVIINIQPMPDIRSFLGLNQPSTVVISKHD